MYEGIKKVIKFILPPSFFKKNKQSLRNLISCFYSGTNHQCNICEVKLSHFVALKNGDLLCPRCGSLPRTRSLMVLFNEMDLSEMSRVLHFSPTSSLRKKLSTVLGNKYLCSDFVNEFDADVNYDITDIPEKDNEFDLIICFHVLEHIEDDAVAIKELYRILKPGGKCIVQTPYKEGNIYEDYNFKTKEERKLHFGQEDHVRIYSVQGLQASLEQSGFQVQVAETFSDAEMEKYKLSNNPILIAEK